MYNQDYDKEFNKVVEYALEKGISLDSYFTKDYLQQLPKVSNHFGERINASTWAVIEYMLLYRVKRDLKILPEYKFMAELELLSKNNYYVSIPRDVCEEYGNRTIGVKVSIGGISFVDKVDVSAYCNVFIPSEIVEKLNLTVGMNVDVTLIEYIDSQDIEIPNELENAFTPFSRRYFMSLSYTDKMKFIDYINTSSSSTIKKERITYCVSLLDKYKKFQDR